MNDESEVVIAETPEGGNINKPRRKLSLAEYEAAVREKNYLALIENTSVTAGFAETTTAQILAEFGNPVSASNRKRLTEIDGQVANLYAGIVELGTSNRSQRYKDQFKGRAEAVAKGSSVSSLTDAYTKTELADEDRAHMKALKHKRRELEAERAAILQKALEAISPHAAEYAKRVEESEKLECKRFGLDPFTPSALVITLRAFAHKLKKPAAFSHFGHLAPLLAKSK